MRKLLWLLLGLFALGVLALSLGLTGPAQAGAFPEIISLPDGWRPEGVATGRGNTLYAGSLAGGGIYQVDLRTGAGSVLVPQQQGARSGGTLLR